MSADLKALRKIAEAATPGPWFVYDRGIGYEVHHASGYELNNGQRETFTKSDATHIATFDPPTVLALIARIADLESKLSRAKNVAGVMASRNVELTEHNRENQDLLTRVSTLFVGVTIDHGGGVTEDLNATIRATIDRALEGEQS